MRKTAVFLVIVLTLTLCSCGKKQTSSSAYNDEFFDIGTNENSDITSSNEDASPVVSDNSKQNGNNSSSQTEIVDNPRKNEDTRTIVACWGDSITEGMGMHSLSYPTRLQEMLGDEFKVLNGGDGGENSLAIAARQGGIKIYTSRNIYFSRGEESIFISSENQGIFVTSDNRPVTFTSLLGNGILVNDVTIGDQAYTLRFDSFTWSPRQFKLSLNRKGDLSKVVDIKKGSEVILNSANISTKGGIDIYMMGANGGYTNDSDYISQLKSMVEHHGNDKYIIVKPYWSNVAGLESAFGNHILDFKSLALQNGLEFEGLTPTENDKEAYSKNEIPASLHNENNASDVHLNQYGYHFLAHCIYEKGKELGYFN